MKANWQELQTQFWKDGYCILDNLIPKDLVEYWAAIALDLSTKLTRQGVKKIEKQFDAADLETRDAAGIYSLVSIPGYVAFCDFENLKIYYQNLANFLSLFTGLDIVLSEDIESAVTVMVYPPPAGQMTAHYDTNPITVLLYLTDNQDGGTELYPLTARRPTTLTTIDEFIADPIVILPKVGRIVLFQGQKIWHKALPVTKTTKISSAWNYYIKGENWRPKGVSERLYK